MINNTKKNVSSVWKGKFNQAWKKEERKSSTVQVVAVIKK